MADKLTLLFLCTGNSCRSQMAKGWGKQFAAGRIVAQSAGIEAHGKNPRAIAFDGRGRYRYLRAEVNQGVAGHD